MDINEYRNCKNKLIAWEWMIFKHLERIKEELFY